jgi:hypothetical protein
MLPAVLARLKAASVPVLLGQRPLPGSPASSQRCRTFRYVVSTLSDVSMSAYLASS